MEKQLNDARKPKKQHSAPARNWVGDNGKIIEPLFADYFLSLHPMRCFQGRLFTVDGMIEDEAPLKKEIYEQVRYYATTSVARRIEHIMQAIKLACASEPPEIQTDRIHVRNGTYFVGSHFTPEKEYCMNRLPIAYVPEAPAPTRWLQFLNELLYEEDIPALQEYIGYCLLPVTKAQKMLLMVGKGGEGKSRIGLILRELFGSSMYTGSLQKVETNRFARADLEYKLLLVDDDMKTEALPQTNNIKTLVTLEDKIDIERKGQQSVQGTLYVRFACFGNGSLHALYDKSNGFYRRQLLLTTKEKPVGRVDDPFLIDKMRNEKEGILLWALEGLHRLIQNNYQFTISERTAANLKEAMEQGNNSLGFLKSEGYFEIRQGAKCKSTDFYKVYERWCLDNLEKPLAASTFIHHLKDNQKSLGIVYDDKCIFFLSKNTPDTVSCNPVPQAGRWLHTPVHVHLLKYFRLLVGSAVDICHPFLYTVSVVVGSLQSQLTTKNEIGNPFRGSLSHFFRWNYFAIATFFISVTPRLRPQNQGSLRQGR